MARCHAPEVRAYLVKIHLIKASVLLLLLGLFYACDGFDRPRFDDMDRTKRRLGLMWMCSVALYVFGAYAALWGTKTVGGPFHPTSLRSHYVAVGILAMIGGFVIMRSVKWMETERPAALTARWAPVRIQDFCSDQTSSRSGPGLIEEEDCGNMRS